MKWLVATLLLLLLILQYRLWVAEGSLAEQARLEVQVEQQRASNQLLQKRNRQLELEVLELQKGLESIEERARSELGMIKEGEIFYQLLPKPVEKPADGR